MNDTKYLIDLYKFFAIIFFVGGDFMRLNAKGIEELRNHILELFDNVAAEFNKQIKSRRK